MLKLVGSGTNGRIASDNFGYSVSIYGDTAVVGANLQDYNAAGAVSVANPGAAYVYTRTAGVWTQEQKLVGSGTNGRKGADQFGYSVSIYSDTIVVGAYQQGYDAAGTLLLSAAGAAYVYTRTAGVWTQEQKLVGSGTNGRIASDNFGYSVSVYGDTIVVGAYVQSYNEVGGVLLNGAGAAYVYTRASGVWTQEQKLVGSGTNGRVLADQFGWSVSIYGDTIVVGANIQDYNEGGAVSLTSSGAAYVYTRTSGVWTQEQKLVGSGTNGRVASDYFGQSVSVYGDTIVVGAKFQDYDATGAISAGDAGAAYVYTRTSGVWTQQQKLVGSGTNGRIANDQFGWSVSIYGDTIVVGSYLQDYNTEGSILLSAAGAAYVFTNSDGVWTQQNKLVGGGINGRIAGDQFGNSVFVYNHTVIVGANTQDYDADGSVLLADAGAAYITGRFSNYGQTIVGKTATQLPGRPAFRGVVVKSYSGNTSCVIIGDSSNDVCAEVGNSAGQGLVLFPGESTTLYVNNTSLIWAISDVDNQIINWAVI
jgi:hypothetical protein